MLLQLNIKNFALIEEISINFEKGFNVLTGETGTGKSILIDAINYILGGKFSRDVIRTGSDKTFVEGIFSIGNNSTKEILKKLDIKFDDILIISRETFSSGKSNVRVNSRSIILTKLRELSSTLLDIHGQHENQNLLDPSMHIKYLDNFASSKLTESLELYEEKFDELKKINMKIEELSKSNDIEKVIDYYKFQLEDIEKVKLKQGEDIELENKYKILSNAENIKNILSKNYMALYEGGDDRLSVFDTLSSITREFRTIEEYDERIKSIDIRLDDIYYSLEGVISDISSLKDSINYDAGELEYINSRLFQIEALKKKYGSSIEEILIYEDKLKKDYKEMIDSEAIILKLKEKREKILDNLKEISLELHNERNIISKNLIGKIQKELSFVGLEKSTFYIDIEYNSENLFINGSDKVKFMISTNPGEPLSQLDKVVSGGELSRIMLALKTVFIDKDNIPSVIFDEIDTGISGRIAQSVGEKMYGVSTKHQVFCITHLPQIAALSDAHYVVSKKSIDNKTFSSIKRLNEEEKVEEISRILGGREFTKLAFEHAKELIEITNKIKNKIRPSTE